MPGANNIFEIALVNFDSAKIIRSHIKDENDIMINMCSYHLQQALELSLKYTLEINGIEYPNTHRIEDLLRIGKINKVDLHINEYINEHDTMFSSFEANTRYIVEYLVDLDKVDRAINEVESYLKELIKIYN